MPSRRAAARRSFSFPPEICLADDAVKEAIARGIIEIEGNSVRYNLNQKRTYDWTGAEEWVRAWTIAVLAIRKGYPANRMRTEVAVPRRTPNDFADIVVYRDDRCREPYLVVECKHSDILPNEWGQAIEQLFGNCHSLRAPLGLVERYTGSNFYDIENFPSTERLENLKGTRDAVPSQYDEISSYTYIAGSSSDIQPVPPNVLESRIRRAHSLIWSGGLRTPMESFDEWSKLLFAKVIDERTANEGEPRAFQVGTKETTATVATRIHTLFAAACRTDSTIFADGTRIALNDKKIFEVVRVLQDVSFTGTDVDAVGIAFENFFGSVFRGQLGQYFTMRQLARFTVGMLDVTKDDIVIDPTCGSGGFLLEALLQVWHSIDARLPAAQRERAKIDFALHRVYGIEIHDKLARICKINLLLHHDGHTNIEGGRSCLDSVFTLPRLNPPESKFTVAVGNPPFGDEVLEGDEDKLGSNHLGAFSVAAGRDKIDSEHVVLERAIALLTPGGRLGFVVPDGMLNNQGEQSNCPRVRRLLMSAGAIDAVISLPDFAFRKSGAQNKTSILIFRKYTEPIAAKFNAAYERAIDAGADPDDGVQKALEAVDYHIFFAEAVNVGYTPTALPTDNNDLFRGAPGGVLSADQANTILGRYREFRAAPDRFAAQTRPDCVAVKASDVWKAHPSHRIDPKYFIFVLTGKIEAPAHWITARLGDVLKQRLEVVSPETTPDVLFKVMTISQEGEIRQREAGKGRSLPDWRGMYFENSPSSWYRARAGDVVYSSIDLWKGCIAVVPIEFDAALVTKEFPIYEIVDERLDPNFLSILLRSRYYQRAFRAITTGHSNRRRTQSGDFEDLVISFPPDRAEQARLIQAIINARKIAASADAEIRSEFLKFSDMLDHRGEEELPDVAPGADTEEEE